MRSTVHWGKHTVPITLALMLATPGSLANTNRGNPSAPMSTTPMAKQKAPRPPDFHAGLWKEVITTHIWGPFTKHQTHKECWQIPTPQVTDKKLARKCINVKIVRKGNTYIVDEMCPASGHQMHLHLSRTYAGNTATEAGTIKMQGLTAHVKARAKRIGKCPATATKR